LLKPCLCEVPVEGEGGFDSEALHDRKGRAVRKREIFVPITVEPLPRGVKISFLDAHEGHRRAEAQPLGHGPGAIVVQAAADERYGLVKNVRGGDERLRAKPKGPSEGESLLVVLVVGVFEGEYEAGVEEERRHASFPYRYSSCRSARSPSPL